MGAIGQLVARILAEALSRPDSRFEDNPALVRDPGNTRENDGANVPSTAPLIDPQLLPLSPRYEMPPDVLMARRRFKIAGGA